MGVKKRLKISESQLALLNLLCTRPVWLTDLSFAQLVELTVLLLHSNGLVEYTQLLELTVLLCFTRMNYLSAPSARWLTCYASAGDVSADVYI